MKENQFRMWQWTVLLKSKFWKCFFRNQNYFPLYKTSFTLDIAVKKFIHILFTKRQFSQWPIIMLGLLSLRNHPILLTDQGGYITLLTSSRRRILGFLRSRSNLARHVITRGVLWWIGSASFVIGSSDNGVIPAKNLRQFLSELC